MSKQSPATPHVKSLLSGRLNNYIRTGFMDVFKAKPDENIMLTGKMASVID